MSVENPEKKTCGDDKVEDDDVVFIGNVIPKPMISNKKKRQKQQTELRKSKSVDGSIVITQKLKVKKRKHRCKLNAGSGVTTKQSVLLDDSTKNSNTIGSFEHQKSVNDPQGFVRFTPICFRKSCRDVRCLIQSNIKKSKEKKKKTGKSYSGFPRDLKGLLSPVSLNSLSKSTDFEISLETSSFEDNKESNLDTLIKRTRERDRNNKMARTKQLSTPPHEDKEVSNKNTEEKETCTDHIPLYTSTPKYEEQNDKNNISIANNIEKLNITHDTIFKEAQSVLSPIKKSDNICTVINTNNEQHVNNQNDSLTKQTNDISNTSSTNYGDNMSISDSDHLVQQPNQPISVLVGVHTLQSNTEHPNNVVENTNLGKSLDSKIVCLCNNNDVAKLLSLNNNPHPVENTPDKSSTNTNKPLSNQDCQKSNDNGQIISNNNYNISQPLNQMCVPLSTNIVPISEHNMYLQLGLIQLDSEGKPILGNKTDMQMSAFNNNQGLESNCKSGFYNNSCTNYFQIPYLVDNNIPMQFSEYQKFVNSVQTNDQRYVSFSQNDDTTKKLYLDNSSFSSCSNKHIDQNVEQQDKPNQNYIPLHRENVEPNNTEYMSPPYNIFRDQNIEIQSQNIYNFSRAQNQKCATEIPLSEDLLHKKPDYTHTSINKIYEQKVKDNVNSSCDDYSFSWEVNVLIPEEHCNKPEDIRQDLPREDLKLPPNDERDRQASPNADPHFDEGKYSKSEYEHEFPNIEHDNPSYHNHNFNRYSSRERSVFYDEIVEHRNLEYSWQRKYSDTNHEQFSNDRSPRDHYRETFEEIDEYIHMKNEKFAYRRSSSISYMNHEQNTEDRGMARSKENNNNIKRRNWNDKPNYDNVNDRYKDADTFYNARDIEDENISTPDRFTGPKSRDYKQFLIDIRQKRFDYEKTVIDAKKNKLNTEGSTRCSSRNKKIRRSPFVEDFHVIQNEESEYYMNEKKTAITKKYYLTKPPNKNYRSLFEDKRTHNKEFKKRNNNIQDIKRPSSEMRDKNRQKRDRNTFFEEEDFQYKKSDYTYKHTVHTNRINPNCEHKRREFDNNNQRNKPHIKNLNIRTQLNTVSDRKYKKVVHKT